MNSRRRIKIDSRSLPEQDSRNANSFAFYANTNRNSIKVAIKALTIIGDYLTVDKNQSRISENN